MAWSDLLVRAARAAAAAVLVALLVMLVFAAWAATGDAVARGSPDPTDANPFATSLTSLGLAVGLLAGLAAFAHPIPVTRGAWFWSAVLGRAGAGAALVGFVVARAAALVPEAQPVPLVALTTTATAVVLLLLAWPDRRANEPRPAPPPPRPDVERPRSVATVRQKGTAAPARRR